jgi:phosphonate transport system substrate-binding protein
VGYRVLSRSEAFPSAALGTPHNLDPELAKQLESAALGFDWAGTGLEREFASSGKRKFVPVRYKDDFALVRKIDDDTGVRHVPPR